jgi:tetratricopeptide (TPR) repeat protein
MNNNRIEYDLFISYARLDNQNGWIKAYVEELALQFKKTTGGRELNYFWDTERISDFSHWQDEIFNKGIVRSKLFLAFLSPNYFASEVCRREWRAWIEQEIGMHILSEGAAPIYIIEIPAMFGKPEQHEAETARQVAELCKLPLPHDLFIRETEILVREFRRRQLHVVQHFYNAGLEALLHNDLKSQLEKLAIEINKKTNNLYLAATSPSTVPTYNSKFTGRVDELVELRQLMKDSRTGVVAGIHGLGGIGKTELAFAFAHAYAGVYSGGRYYVRCEGHKSIVSAFCSLEDDPFYNEITETERKNPDANMNAILRAIGKRLIEKGPVLLLFDNVSEPELLQPSETSRLTKLGPQLHLLATTRLPSSFGIKTLILCEMKHDDGLALLEKYRPFATESERIAASGIVDRLGGFALALELVASRMLVKKSLTYQGVLQGLNLDLLDAYAEDQNVVLQRHNHEKRLEQVLQPTLDDLCPAALMTLRLAALMPPDRIVLPWLRELIILIYPEFDQSGPDGEDPWLEMLHSLFSLSIINGNYNGNEPPAFCRLHRLIGDYLRRDKDSELFDLYLVFLSLRAIALIYDTVKDFDFDLEGLINAIPNTLNDIATETFLARQMTKNDSQKMINHAKDGLLSKTLFNVKHKLNLKNESDFISLVQELYQRNENFETEKFIVYISVLIAEIALDHCNSQHTLFYLNGIGETIMKISSLNMLDVEYQRLLNMCFNKTAFVYLELGCNNVAKRFANQAIDISIKILNVLNNYELVQHDLSVSYLILADLFKVEDQLKEAKRFLYKCLKIRRNLALKDPNSIKKQRDLVIIYSRLGILYLNENKKKKLAFRLFNKVKTFHLQITEIDPDNKTNNFDLACTYLHLGLISLSFNNLESVNLAKDHFNSALSISNMLLNNDGNNSQLLLHISDCHANLAKVEMILKDIPNALLNQATSLGILENLINEDPSNSQKKNKIIQTYNFIGRSWIQEGDLNNAQDLYKKLVDFINQTSIHHVLELFLDDVFSSIGFLVQELDKNGDYFLKKNDYDTANKEYHLALEISQKLITSNIQIRNDQKTVVYYTISMFLAKIGHVHTKNNDRLLAQEFIKNAIVVLKQIELFDNSLLLKKQMSAAYIQIGCINALNGEISQAKTNFLNSWEIRNKLARSDENDEGLQRDLAEACFMLGNIEDDDNNTEAADQWYRNCLEIYVCISQKDWKITPNEQDVIFFLKSRTGT